MTAKPRKKPYTAIGIRRVKCSFTGCNNKAHSQWECCALGGFHPVCWEHDWHLNALLVYGTRTIKDAGEILMKYAHEQGKEWPAELAFQTPKG